MSKTPDFKINRKKRIEQAEMELEQELPSNASSKLIRSTFAIESSLFYTVKEIALKRKRHGKHPCTLKEMITEAFKVIIDQENTLKG